MRLRLLSYFVVRFRSHFGSRLIGWTYSPPFWDPLAACGWGGRGGPVGLESAAPRWLTGGVAHGQFEY
jgi:hypothetical protein